MNYIFQVEHSKNSTALSGEQTPAHQHRKPFTAKQKVPGQGKAFPFSAAGSFFLFH